MDRRRFLLMLAAGVAGAAVGRGTADLVDPEPALISAPRPAASVPRTEPPLPAPVDPPMGIVDTLPSDGAGLRTGLALTIDDGTNTEVVAAFTAFAVDSGVRLTFFPNGRYSSWEDNARALRPLVESGQVAMGNHTWSHPDITELSDREVAQEIGRNRDFLGRTFGVADTPFFRPPFGARDERTDAIAADLGHPTIAMWNGTLGDHKMISGAELLASARKWFTAQAIVVGHANHETVTTVYGELLDLIAERRLRTVTLADVWATTGQRLRGAIATGLLTSG